MRLTLGEDISLPVADLLRTVVFLQVLPFAAGLLIRYFNQKAALEWDVFAQKVIGPAFVAVGSCWRCWGAGR